MDTDDRGKGGAEVGRMRQGRITRNADPRMSRSVEYGLAVLQCFSSERTALGIADIADLVAMSRSTTHRYVTTLTALGYLEQGARRKYSLAPHAADAGIAVIGALRLSTPARAILEELREHTGHTVSVGVLDGGGRALYIDRIPGHHAGQYEIDTGLGVGVSVPAHCTAFGKALLAGLVEGRRRPLIAELKLTRHGPNTITQRAKLVAELDRVREQGFALSDEEYRRGMRAIGAPIVDPRFAHPLAIDVAAPSFAFSARELSSAIGPLVKRAAEAVAGVSRDEARG